MATNNVISPVPNNQPVLDQRGFVSIVWSGFFNELWLRAGGSQASSNTQLQSQISTFVASAPNSIKGNNSGTARTAFDLSVAQVTAMLNLFTDTLKGLVPPSGGGTTKFLRADGSWQIPSGLESFISAVINTASAALTSAVFTNFSNSPAFTFTPTIGGTYKVYCSIPTRIDDPVIAKAAVRINKTSGVGTLLAESRALIAGDTSVDPLQASIYCQSVYTLTAGVAYVFDIQGALIVGTNLFNDGTDAQFYVFAERIS